MQKRALGIAGLIAGSLLLVAGPTEAQSSCGSSAKVASAIWEKVGASVKAKGCKNVDECMSKKDKWEGVFRHGGAMYSGPFFEVQGKKYFSPTALCQAHSERITENHPRATKPGNGWVHINLAPKPGHKWGPTIGSAYDSHAW
jgi:hypothetical protein